MGEKAARRLGTQLDERRSPRTSATVNQMLDKYSEFIDRDASTVSTYVGYADRQIRPAHRRREGRSPRRRRDE
jgi:integrase